MRIGTIDIIGTTARIADGENGSITLEYALLLSVGVTILVCCLEVYAPGIGYSDNLGKPLISYFQRILSGIAMPIP